MKVSYVNTMNPVLALRLFGQSVWLDYIGRSFITSGALQRLIAEDGLGGVTSNPTIFEKAITGSSDYAEALRGLGRVPGLDTKRRYERLAIEDIQTAADLLQPVYARTKRRDGYVSLEVSPYLARDTQGTLDEARRLWDAVGRDNLMIKVPATPEGIPANSWRRGAPGLNNSLPSQPAKKARGSSRSIVKPLGLRRSEVYGADRLFVYIRLQAEAEKRQDDAVAMLERAGQPVVRISVSDLYDLGQEFFRWEFAIAVAGAIIGLNPFNQPDVEASKLATTHGAITLLS